MPRKAVRKREKHVKGSRADRNTKAFAHRLSRHCKEKKKKKKKGGGGGGLFNAVIKAKDNETNERGGKRNWVNGRFVA